MAGGGYNSTLDYEVIGRNVLYTAYSSMNMSSADCSSTVVVGREQGGGGRR